MASGDPAPRPSKLKPLLDFGPLLVFFAVNARWGLLPATGALIPLSVAALFLSWKLEGEVSRVALFGTIAVIVFGGLTLALHDDSFIKVKLTVLNAAFGLALLAGLLRRKSLLKALLGSNLRLTDAGWRLLTLRFALFFFFLAGLNEVLRRTLSTDAWVSFKVFGVIGATLVFTLLQAPLLQKHALEEPEG
jgi:intracellular septation protein